MSAVQYDLPLASTEYYCEVIKHIQVHMCAQSSGSNLGLCQNHMVLKIPMEDKRFMNAE